MAVKINLKNLHRIEVLKQNKFSFKGFVCIRIIESQNSPDWKGPQKTTWSNLWWERKPRWHYLAPHPIASWKPSVKSLEKVFQWMTLAVKNVFLLSRGKFLIVQSTPWNGKKQQKMFTLWKSLIIYMENDRTWVLWKLCKPFQERN